MFLKNIVTKLYFKATFLLCKKISSNRETTKQYPRKLRICSVPHSDIILLHQVAEEFY